MKIHVVTPITTEGVATAEGFAPLARPGTVIDHTTLEFGPASIESFFDEALALPDTVRRIVGAEAQGYDASVVNCMGDPGLSAAREATSMLVLGPAQCSMHVAAMLAMNFSVITVSDSVLPMISKLAGEYGLAAKLCSIRSVNIPVLALEEEERLRDALFAESLRAVEDDAAHAIILGCTAMFGWTEELQSFLAEAGHPGITVIDPIATTIKVAEALADLGLRPSARTYPRPKTKAAPGYEDVASAVASQGSLERSGGA